MQKFSLNGKWELKFKNLSNEVIVAKMDDEKDNWYEAKVPGDVHLDMMKAGLIDDQFYGRNADHCLWMESKDWWYRKTFEVPETFAGKAIYLRFAGLDTFATVFLNREMIGKHKNMFTPLEIEVTKYLKMEGENELLVKLSAPLYGVNPDLKEETGANDPLTVYTRKASMSYGWDIAPRLLTIGIWKDVDLLAFNEVRITDVYIHTDEFSKKKAVVSFEVEVQKEVGGTVEVELRASIGKQKQSIEIKQTGCKQKYTFKFDIKDPLLWWPNGYGEPNLYSCQVRLLKAGVTIDTKKSDFGIRKIELVQEPHHSFSESMVKKYS